MGGGEKKNKVCRFRSNHSGRGNNVIKEHMPKVSIKIYKYF